VVAGVPAALRLLGSVKLEAVLLSVSSTVTALLLEANEGRASSAVVSLPPSACPRAGPPAGA
jgi:hypothetical protein